jgi:hypothetical protein
MQNITKKQVLNLVDFFATAKSLYPPVKWHLFTVHAL